MAFLIAVNDNQDMNNLGRSSSANLYFVLLRLSCSSSACKSLINMGDLRLLTFPNGCELQRCKWDHMTLEKQELKWQMVGGRNHHPALVAYLKQLAMDKAAAFKAVQDARCTCYDSPPETFRLGASWASGLADDIADLSSLVEATETPEETRLLGGTSGSPERQPDS
jgi:hypothetical protein